MASILSMYTYDIFRIYVHIIRMYYVYIQKKEKGKIILLNSLRYRDCRMYMLAHISSAHVCI